LQVGVDACRQDGKLAVAFGLFGDVRVKGKAQHHQQVVAQALHGFDGGFFDQVGANGAMLGANADGRPPGCAAGIQIFAHGVNPGSGKGLQVGEFEPLAFFGVLHPGGAQVINDQGFKPAGTGRDVLPGLFGFGAVFIGRKHPVR